MYGLRQQVRRGLLVALASCAPSEHGMISSIEGGFCVIHAVHVACTTYICHIRPIRKQKTHVSI